MRRVLIAVIVLVVLALAALAAAPMLIDPGRVRHETELALRRVTGRDVVIAGPTTLSLLPAPTLTARDVRIANPAGMAETDLLRIAAVELRLEVAPLLGGRLVLERLTLANPVLDLERAADGRPSWSAAPPVAGAAPASFGPGTPRPDGLAASVALLRVVDGAVILHAGGRTGRIDRIDLTASAAADGPLRAAGTLRAHGLGLTLDLEAGRSAARMPVRLAVGLRDAAARAELAGELTMAADGAPSLAGRLKLTGDDLAAVVARLGVRLPPALARPFAATGDLVAASGEIRLDGIAATLDDLRVAGTLRVTPTATAPSAALTLTLNQIDLDRLAAAPAQPASAAPPQNAATPPSSAPPPPPDAAPWAGLPADLRAAIDLRLGAVAWRGAVLRDARLQATLEHGEITVTRAAILLPGGSDVALSATVAQPFGEPQMRGAVEAESDNLRPLLDWLGLGAGGVPADRLRKASLASRFVATRDHVDIDGFDLAVDATRLTGAASIALGQRLAFGARLAIDRLNLDAYLPAPQPAASAAVSRGAAQSQAGGAAATAAPGLLAQFDANLDATIESLTWRGQPAGGVHLAGTLQDGELTIREAAVADLLGASATADGAVSGLGGDDPQWWATIASRGPSIGRALRLAAADLDASGRLTGPFTAAVTLHGEHDSVTDLDATLEALGGRLHVAGALPHDDPGAAGLTVELSHPSFARLARSLAPSYQPAGGDPGAVSLTGKLRDDAGRLALSGATLAIGALTVTGDAILDRDGARPKLTGALDFDELAVDRLLPARQNALRGDAAAAAPPVRLAESGPPTAAAGAPARAAWPREPFDLSPLGLIDADLTLTGHRLSYGDWRIEQPALAVTIGGDALEIARLSGGLWGGLLEAGGRLELSGERRLTTTIALRRAALEETLGRLAGASPLRGPGDLDATLTSAGGSMAELVERLGGDIRLTGQDGTVSGIDLDAVAARLKQPSRPGDLLALFHGLAGGATSYRTLDAAFRVERGVIRANDVRLVAASGEGDATVTVDLPAWLLHSRLAFRLAAPPAVPPFVVRLDGPVDAPRVVFDVNALEAYLNGRETPRPPP